MIRSTYPLRQRGGVGAELLIGIATCCHHRCEWDLYCGREFFLEELKLFKAEAEAKAFFDRLVRIASWGVAHQEPERRKLGIMAKRLIDVGRAHWCERNLRCDALRDVRNYCHPQEVTPENGLLLCRGAFGGQ